MGVLRLYWEHRYRSWAHAPTTVHCVWSKDFKRQKDDGLHGILESA